MEWLPDLKLGWLNGWIPVILLSLTDGVLFRIFPDEVVKRLFDRSGWSQKQITFTVIGKVIAFGCLVLLFFSPLKIGSPVFPIGSFIVILGLAGLVKALFDFRNTPLDEPVSRGIYKLSRHPQIVMASIVLAGGCIAIGSWLALLIWALARVFSHFGILGEEEVCLEKYGDSYRQYLGTVPRYFVFF